MAKTSGSNLRGDALAGRAAELGIEIDDYRDAGGSINELELRRRISTVERYASEFQFGKVLVVCIVAFSICGAATFVAMHFLWHPN